MIELLLASHQHREIPQQPSTDWWQIAAQIGQCFTSPLLGQVCISFWSLITAVSQKEFGVEKQCGNEIDTDYNYVGLAVQSGGNYVKFACEAIHFISRS